MRNFGRRIGTGQDRGAVLILVALGITALFLIVAIVIDLGATRSDRRRGQLAVDSAAASAGQDLAETNAEDACETALDYLQITLETTFTLATGDACSDFASCPPLNSPPLSATAPGYVVKLHHPVDDTSPLMDQPSTIGAGGASFASDKPGVPCQRFGVELATTGDSYFGGIAGETERKSNVHAVVVVSQPAPGDRLVNLAVLERKDCLDPTEDPPDVAATRVLRATGQGKIVVAKVIEGGTEFPGRITVDSDGTGLDCGSGATIAATGGNAVIRADGPGTCDDTTAPPTGAGCGAGIIEVYAPGPPGCDTPACFNTGTMDPVPVPATSQLTRAPVDHTFNCKSSYTASGDGSATDERWAGPAATFTDAVTGLTYNSQPIVGCAGSSAYIDNLESTLASGALTSAGFQDYVAAGHPCGDITTPVGPLTGNWHVNCDVTIKDSFTVTNGDVVFDGDVVLTSNSADLRINETAPTPHFVYMRGGGGAELRKDADATMTVKNTMLYIGKSVANVGFAGGAGVLTLTAPTGGNFKNLSVWSESAVTHSFSGQAAFNIDGAFFAPLAIIDYAGQTDKEIAAQFIARGLSARGKGRLTLSPTRGIEVPAEDPTVQLIR